MPPVADFPKRLINKLGLEVEVHDIRETTVRGLLTAVRAHAAHEEAGMYRWATAHLSAPVQTAVSTRLLRMRE